MLQTGMHQIRKLALKEKKKTPWMTSDLSNAMCDWDFHHRKAIKMNSRYHWEDQEL